MSLEQQVANLVEASNNLTGAVNGKVAEIDQRMTQAENEFDQFIEDAAERYKTHMSNNFKVGGEWGKFYPVRIDLRGGPVNLFNIYRHDTYQDKGNINGLNPESAPGTFTASIIAIGDSWGHRTPFYAFDTYHDKVNRFIGKAANHYRVQSMWLWLRGGGITYYLAHESLAIDNSNVVVYDSESPSLAGIVGVYLGGFNKPDYGINFQPILEADIDTSLPSSGYIRGVV